MRLRRVVPAAALAGAVLAVGLLTIGGLGRDGGAAASNDVRTPRAIEVDVRAPTRLPALPVEATRPTAAGATAFALFWFDTLNYSLSHGDTEALASYTGVGCQQCSGYLIGIQRWKTSGARLEGGLTVPLTLAIGPFGTTEPVSFAATYLTTPATVTPASGRPTADPGGRTRGGLTVLWANRRWQVTDVVVDASRTTR